MHSIYIHVPFCLSRCKYCSFYSGEPHDDLPGYPSLVAAEAALRGEQLPPGPAATLYIGGGTPSLLGLQGVGELISKVTTHLEVGKGAEVTVEVNPAGGLPYNKVGALGVTRLSIGVQALQEHHLQKLGRPHTGAQALAAVAEALGAGLAVSADLIYGFEGLTTAELLASAAALCDAGVTHLSAYSLETPEEGGCPVEPATVEAEEAQSLALADYLAGRGLVQYEVSNFCLPGHESRHNLNYWGGGGYIGLGPGAHGFLPQAGRWGTRYWNAPDLGAYRKAVESGQLPPGESEELTGEQALMEKLFLTLRRAAPFSPEDFGEPYAKVLIPHLAQAIDDGDLTESGGGYAPTAQGLIRADGLALWLHSKVAGVR